MEIENLDNVELNFNIDENKEHLIFIGNTGIGKSTLISSLITKVLYKKKGINFHFMHNNERAP